MVDGYWYLATQYTKHPQGQHVAWLQSCRWAAQWIKAGVPVFSPIAHTHPIAVHGEVDPLDWRLWMAMDRPMVDAAKGLIVVMSDGWSKSVGIAEEVRLFLAAGKTVRYWIPSEVIEV